MAEGNETSQTAMNNNATATAQHLTSSLAAQIRQP
jgi:hypothetical protein